MEKINFKQIMAGVSVSLLTLTSLVAVSQINYLKSTATKISENLDTELAKPISPSGELNKPISPENVIAGYFNVQTEGNVVYTDQTNPEEKLHYKAIKSERLKKKDIEKKLMLEVNDSGMKKWKQSGWSWIDYEQGIMYFLFATEEDGNLRSEESFTGNYQLIFN